MDEPSSGTTRARAVATLLVALSAALPARGQYLAVFTDGRVLAVTSSSLAGADRIRLELRSGGVLTVPLSRLESVIADATEEEPAPVLAPPCPPGYVDDPLPEWTPFRKEIMAASRANDLHPWLVAAVIETESAFNRWAVSRAGARGLMQLMPSVWMDARIADPHDVKANLRAGCRHLKGLIGRFGDLALGLAAFNAGPTVVERNGGMPPYRETREFVRRILSRFCPAGSAGAANSASAPLCPGVVAWCEATPVAAPRRPDRVAGAVG